MGRDEDKRTVGYLITVRHPSLSSVRISLWCVRVTEFSINRQGCLVARDVTASKIWLYSQEI